MPVAGAQGAVPGRRRSVAVLHPRGSFRRRRAPALDIDGDRGLGPDGAGKSDELVGAEVAGLELVLPGQIDPRGPGVARSDPPRPAVILRDVPARPADERGTQRPHLLEDIPAHAPDGVARHERHLIDPQRAGAREQDREPRVRVARLRLQREGVLRPVTGDALYRGLAVDAPSGHVGLERHRHAAGELLGLHPDGAVVLDTAPDVEARLMNTVADHDACTQLHPQ